MKTATSEPRARDTERAGSRRATAAAGAESQRDERRLAHGAAMPGRRRRRRGRDQGAGRDHRPDGQPRHRRKRDERHDPVVARQGSRSRGSSVRSIQPANRTQTAVATVIMLRLWRRWFP